MTAIGLSVIAVLFVVLIFSSYLQLLYHESFRLIRRETAALSHFRETVEDRLAFESDNGALRFSLVKHISLPLVGVFAFAVVTRPNTPAWQILLESSGLTLLVMIAAAYVIPHFLYRRVSGKWLDSAVPFARFLAYLVTPISAPLAFFESLLSLGAKEESAENKNDSSEHIEAFITAGAEEGILEEGDRLLIQQVVAFGGKTVREVMSSRPQIVAIGASRSLEDLRQLVIHEQYSRIPVFEETIDQIVGFVHVRDMFELEPEQRKSRIVRDLLRPIRLIPETKLVSELLREMQREGTHMAVVIDEYGNTAGLVTMEDLVEEILGEIHDEHEPDRDVRQEAEYTYVAPGSLDIDRLEELLHFRPEEDPESTTVGGLVAEWLGHVPKVGETAEKDGIRIEVLAGDELRVEQVRVSRLEETATV